MPTWDESYVATLNDRFSTITDGLGDRISDITQGRTAPALDDIALGSGRHVNASALFFDICGFSRRTNRDDLEALGETLYMLDCVIPMVMHVIFDHGGYVEKNTGDGVMGIIGVGESQESAATNALNAAVVSLYVVKHIVNPHLEENGIEPIEAKFGIDMGSLLLARIGTRRGAAKVVRSHITAVGPTANIAFALQEHAGPNEILIGGLVFDHADKAAELMVATDVPDWYWTIGPDDRDYLVWKYTGRRTPPLNSPERPSPSFREIQRRSVLDN
jgi:class 3 adenylate cyclase